MAAFKNGFMTSLLYLISLASCKTQSNTIDLGMAVLKFSFFDHQTKEYFSSETHFPPTKVWYQDSLVIQERLGIRWERNFGQPEKRWNELYGYTFIDLRTRSYYHYKIFSDTAKLIAKWTQPDSTPVNKYGGVWTFYNQKNIPFVDSLVSLSDTVVNGITFKRGLFTTNNALPAQKAIAYFRCDKRGTIIQYDKHLSEKFGCPMVRYEIVPRLDDPQPLAAEIEFVRDTLTFEELKVFAAWEKNARENPVIK